MKKLVSVVLALTMVVSMFTTASAATIGELITSTDDPFLNVELPVEVLARRSGSGEYAKSLSLLDGFTESVGIDYKATLDMENVRTLFDKDFITVALQNDAAAKAEFDAGTVATNVKVTVTYPGATVENASSAGALVSDNTIFSENGARNVGANSVEISYKNKDSLTVSELMANKSSYLADLTFKLEDTEAAKYAVEGNHSVNVALTGETVLTFSTKTIRVTYNGAGSFVLSATMNHILEVVPAVPADCTTKGWTEGVKCKTHNSYSCGANGTKEPKNTIPALGHKTELIEAVAATCIKEGVLAHYKCLLCKKNFKDEAATEEMTTITTSKTAHSLGTHLDEIPATCTVNGLSAGDICTVCGYATTRKVIPAIGHSPVEIPAKAADCTNEGATAGKKCSVCNTVLVAPVIIAATGHKYDDNWNITKQPSESETGSKERVCTVCGLGKETVEIPKLEHTCVADPKAEVVIKEATCTQKGSKQKYCACGLPVGEPEEIPVKPHDAVSVAGKAATCTDEGIKAHYACKNCQGLFSDAACTSKMDIVVIPVDPFNHGEANLRKIPAIAAKCNEPGLTEGEKCIKCNFATKPQKTIPKLRDNPDNFEKIEYKAPTCEATGVIAHLHCTICDEDYTLDAKTVLVAEDYTIPATGHHWGDIIVDNEPTEDAEGKGHRVCDNDASHIKEDITIAKKAHVHNEECEEIILLPTCTEKGKKLLRWTCCGEVDKNAPGADANGIIEIPANGHDYKTVSAVAPTCFKEGVVEHKLCKVCGKRFTTAGEEITDEASLVAAHLEHQFTIHHENDNFIFNDCALCGERVKIPKENKAKVNGHGGIKGEEGKTKEDRAEEDNAAKTVTVEGQITIVERPISEKLETEIKKNDKAQEKKVVLEITVEKITTTTEEIASVETVVDIEKEIVPKTKDLIEIEIDIPEEMQDMVDFTVHRLHKETDDLGVTTEHFDEIKTAKNEDGEYIEISPDKKKIVIYVKKFSEYAVVGYNAIVNPVPDAPTGGGGSSSYTVKLNSNGGASLGNLRIKRGELAELPTPERDGYIFAGWFTDSALTKPFDASTPIRSNMTLYAKWVEVGECSGTNEDNCPCLKFTDLDPTMWYHRGVDFVLNKGMMVGVGEGQFAPDWNVTRAMLVTVLWRAEGRPAAPDASFEDLEDGQYYVDAVNWAAENGVVNGYSESTFAPNDSITREQFAAIMYRYATFKKYDVSAGENTNILSYTDYADISEYAISAMQYAVGSSLMTGRTESTLNPTSTATRAEMATILYRFLNK